MPEFKNDRENLAGVPDKREARQQIRVKLEELSRKKEDYLRGAFFLSTRLQLQSIADRVLVNERNVAVIRGFCNTILKFEDSYSKIAEAQQSDVEAQTNFQEVEEPIDFGLNSETQKQVLKLLRQKKQPLDIINSFEPAIRGKVAAYVLSFKPQVRSRKAPRKFTPTMDRLRKQMSEETLGMIADTIKMLDKEDEGVS